MMAEYIDKTKFLSELIKDKKCGIARLEQLDPKYLTHAISYHIVSDEIEYITSVIEAIERGDYDAEVPE